MHNYELFLDESGNTGDHFADRNQPIYVLAGWVVPVVRQMEADEIVGSELRRGTWATTELKATGLLRSAQGRQHAEILLQSLLEMGCQPVFALYEKRWIIAAKLIELFCDPRTNRRAFNLDPRDAITREHLAEQIYALPFEAIEAVWSAVRRNPSVPLLKAPLDRLLHLISLLPDPMLTVLFQEAAQVLDRIVADLLRQKSDRFYKLLDAPNAPALAAVLNNVDLALEDSHGATVLVVHDESASFEWTLRQTFQMLSTGPDFRMDLNNGNYFRFGMERFVGFDLEQSQTTRMLQAADVLAGTIRACTEDCLFAEWANLHDLRPIFETLVVEGTVGDIPHFMLSQPMFEKLVHPQLARDVTARATAGRPRGAPHQDS